MLTVPVTSTLCRLEPLSTNYQHTEPVSNRLYWLVTQGTSYRYTGIGYQHTVLIIITVYRLPTHYTHY